MNPYNDMCLWYIVLPAAVLTMVIVGFVGVWLDLKNMQLTHYRNAKFVCVTTSTITGVVAGLLIVVESFRDIEQFFLNTLGQVGAAVAYAESLTYLSLMVIPILVPVSLFMMSYKIYKLRLEYLTGKRDHMIWLEKRKLRRRGLI